MKLTKMKQLFFILSLLVTMLACTPQKEVARDNDNTDDNLEYAMDIGDQRFDVWYQYYDKPALYKSQDYYESWNRQYVLAWNEKCAREGKNWRFDPVEGYEPDEDLGFELNHKLFHYFMYVENILKITIVPGGPDLE